MAEAEEKPVVEPKGKENARGLSELQAQLEEIKKLQSGSDKKVGELQTANSELLEALAATRAEMEDYKKKAMSAEDKTAYEKEQLEKERALVKKERLEIAKQKIVGELGIPSEFAPFINGDDESALRQAAQKIKDVYEAKLTENVETKVNERLVTKKPQSGDKPATAREWNGTKEDAAKMTEDEFKSEMLRQLQE